MKRFIAVTSLALAIMLTGCAQATSPTPPLAPGYSNSVDQTMGETLATAHAFYSSVQRKTISGAYIPSPTEKTALNAFVLALNNTQAVYLAYHSGTATQAQAQSSVNSIAAQQAQLQATLAAGVGK